MLSSKTGDDNVDFYNFKSFIFSTNFNMIILHNML